MLVVAIAGFSFVLGLQFLRCDDLVAFVSKNKLPRLLRQHMLLCATLGGLVPAALFAVYGFSYRTKTAIAQLTRLASIASPLMLFCFAPLLFVHEVFAGKELLCALCALGFGLGVERTFRYSLAAAQEEFAVRRRKISNCDMPRWLTGVPFAGALLLTVFFALYFTYYTVLNHYRLQTSSFDLAIQDNIVWNLLRGEWFKASPALGYHGSHMYIHATFLAYLVAPFYALHQHAETLLFIQASLCALGTVTTFLITRHLLKSGWAALALCLAYVFYAPIHGPLFYDFHYLTTAPFFVGLVLYAFEKEKRFLLCLAWLLAVLLREDVSAGLAGASLFFLLSGRRPKAAIFMGVASCVYFVSLKLLIMPRGATHISYTYIYDRLFPQGDPTFTGVLKTIASNPFYVLMHVFKTEKLTYALQIIAPLLFLPLRQRFGWTLVLYPSFATLLSTGYEPVIKTSFQYTSLWTPYVFFGAAKALASWRADNPSCGNLKIGAALVGVLATTAVLSYHKGAILSHDSFEGGFRRIVFEVSKSDRDNHRDLYALIKKIPKHASVAASENEAPHVSNRANCFSLRYFYLDADYLLVNWEVTQGSTQSVLFKALSTGQYGFVAQRGKFALWKRGYSHALDAKGNALVGYSASSAALHK